jgi:hypothetical protein
LVLVLLDPLAAVAVSDSFSSTNAQLTATSVVAAEATAFVQAGLVVEVTVFVVGAEVTVSVAVVVAGVAVPAAVVVTASVSAVEVTVFVAEVAAERIVFFAVVGCNGVG